VNAGLTPLLQAVVVGAWDLGYVPTLLEKIDVVVSAASSHLGRRPTETTRARG
jgi:hypothetical protein